jgi:hypothetical protein
MHAIHTAGEQIRQRIGTAEILHYVGVIFCLLLMISFKSIAVLNLNEFSNDVWHILQ